MKYLPICVIILSFALLFGCAGEPKDAASYQLRALSKAKDKDYSGAMADINKAIELEPANAKLYKTRAQIESWKGDSAGAIADYSKVIEMSDPRPDEKNYKGNVDASDAYNNRAKEKIKTGDYSGAIVDFTKSFELSQNPMLYRNIAIAKIYMGDEEGARLEMEKIRAVYPTPAELSDFDAVKREVEREQAKK